MVLRKLKPPKSHSLPCRPHCMVVPLSRLVGRKWLGWLLDVLAPVKEACFSSTDSSELV